MQRRTFLKTAALWPAGAMAQQQPIYLQDFRRARPEAVLANKWMHGRWRVVEYESDLGPGYMLAAGHNTMAPEVEVPLDRKGWYAVYFGLRSAYGESRLQARLKGDQTFTLITQHDMTGMGLERRDIEVPGGTQFTTGPKVEELFWKYAELDSQSIVLRQLVVENVCSPVWLAYIKLVPLTEAEVRALQDDRRTGAHKRLFAHNDAFGSASWLAFTTADEIRREVEPYRSTDFSRMYWEAGMGDRMYYPSKIGRMSTDEWISDPFRKRDRYVADFYRACSKKGIDPLRVALEASKAAGLEFHAGYRVAGFHFPVPEEEWNAGGLYDRHAEWRGSGRDGKPTPRLSYAYEGVRRYVLSLIEEMCRYPLDGICLLYNRRPPLLEYEAPLVDGFQAKYGKDPRRLDDKDADWLKYRAGVLTAFMRDVRRIVRRPMGISVIVMGTEAENLYNAIDLNAWVSEGLVDTIIPYMSGSGLNSSKASFVDPRDAEPFVRLTKGTPCKLAVNLMPRQIAPEDYRRRAHGLYQAGVENLFFWDCYQRNDFSHSWTTLRRLGHKEEIAAWMRSGAPKIQKSGTTLRKLGDWDLRYATPG